MTLSLLLRFLTRGLLRCLQLHRTRFPWQMLSLAVPQLPPVTLLLPQLLLLLPLLSMLLLLVPPVLRRWGLL